MQNLENTFTPNSQRRPKKHYAITDGVAVLTYRKREFQLFAEKV